MPLVLALFLSIFAFPVVAEHTVTGDSTPKERTEKAVDASDVYALGMNLTTKSCPALGISGGDPLLFDPHLGPTEDRYAQQDRYALKNYAGLKKVEDLLSTGIFAKTQAKGVVIGAKNEGYGVKGPWGALSLELVLNADASKEELEAFLRKLPSRDETLAQLEKLQTEMNNFSLDTGVGVMISREPSFAPIGFSDISEALKKVRKVLAGLGERKKSTIPGILISSVYRKEATNGVLGHLMVESVVPEGLPYDSEAAFVTPGMTAEELKNALQASYTEKDDVAEAIKLSQKWVKTRARVRRELGYDPRFPFGEENSEKQIARMEALLAFPKKGLAPGESRKLVLGTDKSGKLVFKSENGWGLLTGEALNKLNQDIPSPAKFNAWHSQIINRACKLETRLGKPIEWLLNDPNAAESLMKHLEDLASQGYRPKSGIDGLLITPKSFRETAEPYLENGKLVLTSGSTLAEIKGHMTPPLAEKP